MKTTSGKSLTKTNAAPAKFPPTTVGAFVTSPADFGGLGFSRRDMICMKLLAIVLLSLAQYAPAQTTIFSDDFSADPATNGWMESTVSNLGAMNGTGSITSNGTAAVLEKTGGASTANVINEISRIIDTTGFQSITADLVAFQSTVTYEVGAGAGAPDFVSIEFDTGAGRMSLLRVDGIWPGGGAGAGNTVATSSGSLALPAAAANNAALQIFISIQVFAQDEDYFFDNFTLAGVAIPPAAADSLPVDAEPQSSQPKATTTVLAVTISPELEVIEVRDLGAISSILTTGRSMAQAHPQASYLAARAGLRDINERLFRLRSGLGAQLAINEAPLHIPFAGAARIKLEDPVFVPQSSSLRSYVSGDFNLTDQDPIQNLGALDSDTYAGSIGVEWQLLENLAIGAAWTYLESNHEIERTGAIDILGHHATAYASYSPGSAYIDLLYSAGIHDHEIARQTGLGSIARGETNSTGHTAELNAGWNWRNGEFSTGPMLGLAYSRVDLDGYAERDGGGANLDIGETALDSLVGRLGWQASWRHHTDKFDLIPQLRVAWEHEADGGSDPTRLSLHRSPFLTLADGAVIPGAEFSLDAPAVNPPRDYLSLGAGFRLLLRDQFAVTLDYEGQYFRGPRTAHFGSVRVSLSF